MFFKLLKLAGLDINAKIAELKADLAFKAEQASEEVTRKARAMAMVAGLLWCAGIFALLALIVGLFALYKWGEIHYGVFTGLTFAGVLLVVLTTILVVAALWIARQSASESSVWRIVRESTPFPKATRQLGDAGQDQTGEGFVPPSSLNVHREPEDFEPLIVLLNSIPPSRRPVIRRLMICLVPDPEARLGHEEAVARGSISAAMAIERPCSACWELQRYSASCWRAARSTRIFIPDSDLRDRPADGISHDSAAVS